MSKLTKIKTIERRVREPIQPCMTDDLSQRREQAAQAGARASLLAAYRAEIRTQRGRLICDISDLLADDTMSVRDISSAIAERIAASLRTARSPSSR